MSEDKRKKELVRKVRLLVETRHGGSYNTAFNFYSSKQERDGKVNREELVQLLSDANVGNMISRGMWADGIMRELDRDGDHKISWDEFETVVGR